MKFLCVADLHLKTRDQFDLENGVVSDRSIYKLKRLRELVEKEDPDTLFILGDDFDSRNPSEPLRTAYFRVLDSFGIPVYLISGNHSQEHGFTAGTSEAYLAQMIHVVQPREVFELDQFTLIGYCRDKEEFLELCKEHPNKYLLTHGDIPSEDLPFEYSFFGHIHQHYSIGNKYSLGALFTDSFGEESFACMYCLIDEKGFEFKEFEDQPIRTFNELVDFEDGEYLAVRFKLTGKAKDFLGIDQEAIKRSYKKTRVFFDTELVEEELVLDDSQSIEEILQDYIAEKSLTETEIKFGKLIFGEIENE